MKQAGNSMRQTEHEEGKREKGKIHLEGTNVNGSTHLTLNRAVLI